MRCLLLACLLALASPAFAVNPTALMIAIRGIEAPQSPRLVGEVLLLSCAPAEPARFVGARFAHESYRLLHLYSLNEHGIFVLDYPVPEGLRELRYRIVIDGLWMADPLNPASLTDAQGDEFSLFTFQREPPRLISNPKPESKERFTFTFKGAPGKRVSIAGDFNNWDPFMDYMAETEPGLYRITIRIGPGNHFYCFVSEGRRILDQYNPETGVNQDGDIVSYFSMPS
jgi:hypothetical protein